MDAFCLRTINICLGRCCKERRLKEHPEVIEPFVSCLIAREAKTTFILIQPKREKTEMNESHSYGRVAQWKGLRLAKRHQQPCLLDVCLGRFLILRIYGLINFYALSYLHSSLRKIFIGKQPQPLLPPMLDANVNLCLTDASIMGIKMTRSGFNKKKQLCGSS